MAYLDGICKLCLKKCENFKDIDQNAKSLFDIFLPKSDFTVIPGQLMCKNCAEVLTKCFDFKEKCLQTHSYIVPFVNKDSIKLDLRDVYLSKNETDIGIAEDENICGLCMDLVKNCSAVSLDVEEAGIALKKMIEQCLPELDLSIIEKPVICAPCRGSLENCLNVDERIKKYCESLDIKSRGQEELNSLSEFTVRDVTTRELDSNSVDVIKVEENPAERTIVDGSGLIKLEQMGFGDSEGANEDVENKYESFMEFVDQKGNEEQRFTPNDMWACAEESNKLGSIIIEEILCAENETKHNEEDLVEMEGQQFFVGEIEIEKYEHDFNRFGNGIVLPQSEVSTNLQRREKRFMPNIEGDVSELYIKRAFENKSNIQLSSEKNMYNCDSCSFQTENKYCLKSHSLVHKDPSEVTMYKCESCSYQTKRKHCMKTHLLLHKDPSELTMYKCDSCSFQTKHKESLTVHFMMHKDPSEVTMHKCASCSFQTKKKYYLKVHSLVHKDSSEVIMYKCDSCSYQTKQKHGLKRHLLGHKDPSEVTMYKCDSCSYQINRKDHFKRHLLTHKDPSEVTMYKCDSCSYQTKQKYCLNSHLLLHKDPSELTMYKCDSCSFQTKHKESLTVHFLTHKDPSEVTMYKCGSCSFQTKMKYYLKIHALVHKDPSEVTMYKCDSCSFQTKQKHCLRRHLVGHKDPSEVTMFKCDSCSYQVKRKDHLKRHLLTHKDPSELTMYKCISCSFQTKCESSIKKHSLKHKDP